MSRKSKTCAGLALYVPSATSGPWERLQDGAADLIIHHINKSDPDLEYIDLGTITLVPVVVPNFLPFPISNGITPEQMRDHVQCIIRDSAKHSAPKDYYVVDGAQSWTVSDQFMKKEIILQGMGWGHLPDFLIEDDLRSGKLLSISGKHFAGGRIDLVAARRRNIPHGPIAEQLWRYVEDQSPWIRTVRKA
jgi:DNA-binding transcriptional LysR family regulator